MKQIMIDLHLHLDGSISTHSARELAKIEGIILPEDEKELERLLQVSPSCQDLNEYLEKFELPGKLMQSSASIARAAENLCEELDQLGCIYAEIRFAPQKHCEKGLTQEQVVEAALKGVANAKFPVNIILCCMRGADRSVNMETILLTEKYLGKGVCACDLAGAEGLFPTRDYGELFQYAKEKNIPFTLHAGEADGPESVWKALEYGTSRLGHGVRSIEDSACVERLRQLRIPLEICPTSNCNTCVYPSISEIPIRELYEAGVIITINSDNMSVSHTNAVRELALVLEQFGWGEKEKYQLLNNAIEASFATEEIKEKLREICVL